MSTHVFTNEEIKKLLQNPCVLTCSERSVTYTYEFKKRALEQYGQGVSSKEIFRKAGLDLSIWRDDYPKDCLKRWKIIVREKGFEGLTKVRGDGSRGRPKTKGLTDADTIKRLELQVKYLQAENDFLVKLRAKRAESNSGQKKNSR